jgi:hypothetical protein
MYLQLCITVASTCRMSVIILVSAWPHSISILTAYDYIEIVQNEWSEDVAIHTGLRAIDITRLVDYVVDNAVDLPMDEDQHADLVVQPASGAKTQ